MKHNFLYMQRLASLTDLQHFVDFYIEEHNTVIPHAAFQGQTPQEVFDGDGSDLPQQLASMRAHARTARIAENQRAHCDACPRDAPSAQLVP